jgi:hypothetical protein
VSRRLLRIVLLVIVLVGAAGIYGVLDAYGGIFRAYTHTETGTYSDFSQTWVATRAILGEHQDPYGAAVLPRIQELYYGHVLRDDDPTRPAHPQGFYYPLFIVWLTWPFALLPFDGASLLFKLVGIAVLVGSTYSYLSLLGWPAARRLRLGLAAGSLLTLGGEMALLGDQPTLLLVGLVFGAVAAAARGRYALAGGLLALAMIKPQLALLPALGLAIWSLGRPERRTLLPGGLATGAALIVSSLLLWPAWINGWIETFSGYTAATAGSGLADGRLDSWLGVGLRAVIAGGALALWWPLRQRPLTDLRLLAVMALTLVADLAAQQPWFSYNLVLLYVPMLALLAALRRPATGSPPPPRTLGGLALAVFCAPWLVFPILYAAYLGRWVAVTGLDWPGFAALYLVAQRSIVDFTIITALFAFTAWAPALAARPAPGVAAEQPASSLPR